MGFLRLSTSCAVFDEQGRVLLSLRGDFNRWNLPSGRVDAHEWLPDAAAREVREETGIEVQVERAVGLFYWQGWDRLNVLYQARPVGGTLLQRTFETRHNQYFSIDQLPGMHDAALVHAAMIPRRIVPQTEITSPEQLQRIRWALRRRYVANLLRGKPEPRHVRFNLRAVGIMRNVNNHLLVETYPEGDQLPRVVCDGSAPWLQLDRRLGSGIWSWQWAGLWQQPETSQVEFIFAAQQRPSARYSVSANLSWKPVADAVLSARDHAYVTQSENKSGNSPVWVLRD